MARRETHLKAAKKHGRKAVAELRHMTADSALHWVLSHKSRVAQFRRAVKGTRAQRPLDRLLALIREEATATPKRRARPAPRRARKRKPARAARRRSSRFVPPVFMIG
jgi:hypothetical protein